MADRPIELAAGPLLSFNADLPPLSAFTPPATCLERITSRADPAAGKGDGRDRTFWVGMVGNDIDTSCYPPQYGTDTFYPAGVCPSGWTSACTPRYLAAVSNAILSADVFPSGFPAVQCCPSQFTCYDPYFCASVPPRTAIPAVIMKSTASTDNIVVPTSDKVWAKPVLVVSGRDTSGPTSTGGAPGSQPPGCEATQSGGLSTEGKIAIAAVVPVTVLAIIVAGVWFLLGRRGRRAGIGGKISNLDGRFSKGRGEPACAEVEDSAVHELHGERAPAELYGHQR